MDILKELEIKNAEVIKFFKEQLIGIRGGRPTTKLVESIQIEYMGQRLAIKQLGSISVQLPREIQIMVWDPAVIPGVVKAVEAAISVKAASEGNLIRINLPALSEERRQELTKLIKKEAEEGKIKIRALRDEFLKKIKIQKEKGEITEDDLFRTKDQIQKAVDKTNEEIDKSLDLKASEINE